LQAVKDAGRALTRQQSSVTPDWLGLCPDGSVTGGIWAMRDDYRTRFAVLAGCGYPGGVDPHVFLLDIDACVTATPADAAVFDSLDQAVAAWREGKGDTARTARPEPVTDYSQLGFLVRCAASPNGPFRGDESRGYADISPHRIRALLAYMDDDWLPEEPATAAAYKLLPEWVRWNGGQADVPEPLIERSVAVAERRQLDISDCPSFRFRPRPGDAP